jgi:hypothetical protein
MKNHDYVELIEKRRKLAAYIKTSLWDEKTNLIREYWLWDRSRVSGNKPKHH